MNVVLAPGILPAIVDHARKAAPQEGCGLIAGKGGMGERFIPMANTLASPTAYEMDPVRLVETMREFRLSGEELVAIYHSHPEGPAEPSARDVERAYYPEAAHLIVSLKDPARPLVRAFRITGGEALEVEVRAIV